MRSGSTIPTLPNTPITAESEQVERASNGAKRKQLKDNRNRRWTAQRNGQRNRHGRAVGSATEGLVEADEEMGSVRLTDGELNVAGQRRKDGSPTIQADPGDSRTLSIELFGETLTIRAKQRSPISTDKDDVVEEGPTRSSLSAYMQGRMRLDPGAYEGEYYKHPERHW
jgi:hypothetical protein